MNDMVKSIVLANADWFYQKTSPNVWEHIRSPEAVDGYDSAKHSNINSIKSLVNASFGETSIQCRGKPQTAVDLNHKLLVLTDFCS